MARRVAARQGASHHRGAGSAEAPGGSGRRPRRGAIRSLRRYLHGSRRLNQHAVRSRPQSRRANFARAVRLLGACVPKVPKSFDFSVNGESVSVSLANEETPLLDVLRNELGLMGTRFGCGLDQCGCCMVLIDGAPEKCCTKPVWSVAGKSVTTIEGLGSADRPHPLQQAFIDEQAGQCGYCLSGILISAKALLDKNPKPTRGEIAQALDGNICRCGSHNRIMRAVEKAAGVMRAGAPR